MSHDVPLPDPTPVAAQAVLGPRPVARSGGLNRHTRRLALRNARADAKLLLRVVKEVVARRVMRTTPGSTFVPPSEYSLTYEAERVARRMHDAGTLSGPERDRIRAMGEHRRHTLREQAKAPTEEPK